MTKVNAFMHGEILDQRTFETIYNMYWKKVFGTCYNHCKDAELSREMVQEIFCSLWERRETISLREPIEHYLVKAAKYKVIDYLRSKPKQFVLSPDVESDFACNTSACTENDVLYNTLTERVGDLVDKLPCQCRLVYKLSREQGLDTKQIASSLLISEKTAKNHLTKALSFLRLNLEEYK